jgi:hypothetical protein
MAANTSPISPIAPATSWNQSVITAANAALDGTGTVGTLLTAGANGSRVNRLHIQHLGTNVATVMRFWLNNGSANTTPANNVLIAEVTVPANTLSQTAASTAIEAALNVVLKPGYKILYAIGTAVASGHSVSTPDTGDY